MPLVDSGGNLDLAVIGNCQVAALIDRLGRIVAVPAAARWRPGHHVRFISPGMTFRVTTNSSLCALLDGSAIVLDAPLAFILAPDETIEENPLTLTRSWLEETRSSRSWEEML